MYQYLIPTRILYAIGMGLLIFSLVFGWLAFSVPDWLQFYEHNGIRNEILSSRDNLNDLKKFGLWYKCIFAIETNDFNCTLWNNDAPSFVRVAQVLIPIGLTLACLSLLTACMAFICTRAFITTVLFAGLFAFLSFVFIIIGTTVFANESLVYVERLHENHNENPRRWGMWLLIPNLVLSFFTSICFIIASILNWCDYRSVQVSGILSHSVGKFNSSVCKLPSDSNTTTALKKHYQYQDYPNACYQINGLNNHQHTPMGYPPPPSYGYQPTLPGLFGYSRTASPTMNPMYPYSHFDPYHPRHYMTENSEIDEFSRSNRLHRRSRSRPRSRSHSPFTSTIATDNNNNNNNQKQTQFIPIPVPYYQPQIQPSQPGPVTSTNTNSQPISYIIPQVKHQFVDDNNQLTTKVSNMLKYGSGQPSVLASNPNPPIYTIAYRPNNGCNMLTSNLLTGSAGTTYVTATRKPIEEINSLNSDSDHDDHQINYKRKHLKKIDINEAWTWRKTH